MTQVILYLWLLSSQEMHHKFYTKRISHVIYKSHKQGKSKLDYQ